MWRFSCKSETWGSDFDHFVKFYSLVSFDAFNGSLVEQCLIHLAGLKLGHIHAFKEKGRQNHRRSIHRGSPVWPVTGTGLTGAGPSEAVGGWPGTCARVARYASVCCRVTRLLWPGDPGLTQLLRRRVIWRQRLWETKHISINKAFMCCDQVWNEPHQVLNWTKCLVREIQKSLALVKGELITTLESLVRLTISSK
jgi:hypothetical protein